MHAPYWIDYRLTPASGITRRWLDTLALFLEDIGELSVYPCEIVAFGYQTPPPLLRNYRGTPREDLPTPP